MSTKNIVPRVNNEGNLGTSDVKWNSINAVNINGDVINGKLGNVSASSNEEYNKYLRGDGTWQTIDINNNPRLSQLENNMAEIALKMEAENMMADCNMMLAENFKNSDSIDKFEVKVISCNTNNDSIDMESNYRFVVGSCYWITDGIHAEYVQVKSVMKNSNIYRIILANPLVETYTISQTKIYRTTAWISESGTAYGSGDVLGVVYENDIIWKGITSGGIAVSNVKLDTSLNNTDSFSIDGDIVFNSDGLAQIKEVV